MLSKELLEKAKKCTSKEELLELAKQENIEVSDEEISTLLTTVGTNKELSDEELENVTGGTCYSSDTFADLGITPATTVAEQLSSYHPVITTMGNICSLHPDYENFFAGCSECKYHHTINPVVYCRARSREVDPGISH